MIISSSLARSRPARARGPSPRHARWQAAPIPARRWLALALAALLGCGGGFPTDPEGTTERIAQTRVLRVGLTEHPPWVVRGPDGAPGGIEVELARSLAAAQGARLAPRWGQQDALLGALESFELDLVLGGLDAATPWSTRVGLTEPWHEAPTDEAWTSRVWSLLAPGRLRTKRVLAVPPGENRWLGVVERFLHAERPRIARLTAELGR